ncbi:MAG: ribbon-helix-helix domain-containing protein [Thermoproteota archaeon]
MEEGRQAEHFYLPIGSPKKVVSVKLEVEIVDEMDKLWRALGYSSRSDFIREAILAYMQLLKNSTTLSTSSKEAADEEAPDKTTG